MMRRVGSTADRLSSVAGRARRVTAATVRGLADQAGYDIVRRASSSRESETIPRGRTEPFTTAEYVIAPLATHQVIRRWYYSPIPDLPSLPADIFERRSALGGVSLDVDRATEFLERELAEPIAELDVPRTHPGRAKQFFLRNDNFESVDAEVLYGMVRRFRPARVMELGSGYTTLLINLAAQRNLDDGHAIVHEAFDPYPREQIVGDGRLPAPTTLAATDATEIPLERFDQLAAGDFLFVDTTHTVKLGSDVNFVVLDVLPRLAPGVIVHFHDIFLPYEYPRVWFEEMEYYWAEQYLLQAFLAYNTEWEVVVPAQAIAREHPERLARVVPSFDERVSPGSLWLRRRAPDTSA